jgi:archaellum component FlaC
VKGVLPLPLSKDPASLLDSLDNKRAGTSEPFDPIDFLNQHYETEQSLSQQLPALREAVGGRMELLNDRISNALQRQSETAESTRRHVETAKASVQALEHRILQVKEKAAGSEKAVLEITAEMKRLDCAKRHLQRTITTLKRLHMLVHAVEQLRNTVHSHDYKTASHLVDAVTQLLQHFDAYTAKVQPMRVLSAKVSEYQTDLRKSVVTGFRVAAFGQEKTMELQGQTNMEEESALTILSADDMQGGVLLIDSLGETCRVQFIHEFCQDYLGGYLKEFEPPSRETKPERRVSSFKVSEVKSEPENVQAGLDQMEKRFSWFLKGPLKSVNEKFPGVFPPHWNLQASMANMFLQLVSSDICSLSGIA